MTITCNISLLVCYYGDESVTHVTMEIKVLYILLWYWKCYTCYYGNGSVTRVTMCYTCYYGNGSIINVTMVMEMLYMLLW